MYISAGTSWVNIWVGGQWFTTTKDTLIAHENGYFEALFSGKFADSNHSNYYLDRNPKYFAIILDILKGYPLNTDSLTTYDLTCILEDSRFLGYTAIEHDITTLIQLRLDSKTKPAKDCDKYVDSASLLFVIIENLCKRPGLSHLFESKYKEMLRKYLSDILTNGIFDPITMLSFIKQVYDTVLPFFNDPPEMQNNPEDYMGYDSDSDMDIPF